MTTAAPTYRSKVFNTKAEAIDLCPAFISPADFSWFLCGIERQRDQWSTIAYYSDGSHRVIYHVH